MRYLDLGYAHIWQEHDLVIVYFRRNCTALLHASHEGHLDLVRFLLQKGANNNWQADVSVHLSVMCFDA